MLFLDEMPEFSRRSLEILRQPLEDKVIHISRVYGNYVFPANFILCAAMNPCPCGYYPDMNRCRCTAGEVSRYLGKISQPILDRIDLCVEVPSVTFSQLRGGRTGESSEKMRGRVEAAREIQSGRYEKEPICFNGELSGRQIETYCRMDDEGEELLRMAFGKVRLSARALHRILKVSRTIADMDGSEIIRSRHVGEALSYRAFEKNY